MPLIERPSATGTLRFENMEVGGDVVVHGETPMKKCKVQIGELTGYLVLTSTPDVSSDDDGYAVVMDVRLLLDSEPTLSQLVRMLYGS